MRKSTAGLGPGLILAAGMITGFPPASQAASTSTPAPHIGRAIAPFALSSSAGKVTVGDWSANGRQATLLLFVSTRCPFSNGYNARMAELAKNFGTRGVRIIGINSNRGETARMAEAHAKQQGLGFPVFKDAGNVVADRFAAKVTPEAFLIDSAGVLRYHGNIDNSLNVEEVKDHNLKTALTAILAHKPVATPQTIAFGCTIKRVGE